MHAVLWLKKGSR